MLRVGVPSAVTCVVPSWSRPLTLPTAKIWAPLTVASPVAAHGLRVKRRHHVLRPFERQPVDANGKPVRIPMHVKTGDLVKVIAGTGKGTVGKILKVFTKLGRVLMRDVNVKVKNVKPRSPEEKGRQIRVEFPIHHSNVAHYSSAHGTHSRVGHRVREDGAKVRYLIKTGEVLEA